MQKNSPTQTVPSDGQYVEAPDAYLIRRLSDRGRTYAEQTQQYTVVETHDVQLSLWVSPRYDLRPSVNCVDTVKRLAVVTDFYEFQNYGVYRHIPRWRPSWVPKKFFWIRHQLLCITEAPHLRTNYNPHTEWICSGTQPATPQKKLYSAQLPNNGSISHHNQVRHLEGVRGLDPAVHIRINGYSIIQKSAMCELPRTVWNGVVYNQPFNLLTKTNLGHATNASQSQPIDHRPLHQ